MQTVTTEMDFSPDLIIGIDVGMSCKFLPLDRIQGPG